MSAVAPATRRLAVLAGERAVDLAAPSTETVGGALAAAGVPMDPVRHALVLRDGALLAPTVPLSSLEDGALVVVIDLAEPVGDVHRVRPEPGTHARSTWWLLAIVSGVVAALALVELATGTRVLGDGAGVAVGGMLMLGAVVAGARWIRRADDGAATAPAAVLLLAFTGGVLAVPAVPGAAHLAITVGLGAAGLLFTALVIPAHPGAARSMAATVATLLVLLAGVWGATLMWAWGAAAAAALSLGLVAPGWRVLPQLLLTLPDGWSIHYRAFMTQRWTVRGAVPEDPGPIAMPVVRRAVEDAVARLIAGVAVLAAVAVLATPVVLAHLPHASPAARIGGAALIALTVIHLLLAPRHATAPALRWLARGAAAAMLAACVIAVIRAAPEVAPVIIAGALMLAGAVGAAAIVPTARGVRSVAWSRAGDVLESVAVALVPAAALVAADVIAIIRAGMAA